MTIDKKYNFKPVYTSVNSFRFSNLIKNEEICEIYKKPDDKIEISIPIVEDNVKLTITDISDLRPNVDLNTCDKIQEFDEIDEIGNYKKKLFKMFGILYMYYSYSYCSFYSCSGLFYWNIIYKF